jgi:transposase
MTYLLTDAQWARIEALLPGRAGTRDGHTLLLDSTTMRAHQHASEARKKTGHKPWVAAAAA